MFFKRNTYLKFSCLRPDEVGLFFFLEGGGGFQWGRAEEL